MELLLENVRSGLNIGSIFRTCDALGIKKIWLSGICALPPHREILKTALGACESVAWEYRESSLEIIKHKKEEGFSILAIEQCTGSTLLHHCQLPQKGCLLILGNEVEGVSAETLSYCDNCIEIPQFGIKKSLNVAVSAGIVLWHFTQLQLLKKLV